MFIRRRKAKLVNVDDNVDIVVVIIPDCSVIVIIVVAVDFGSKNPRRIVKHVKQRKFDKRNEINPFGHEQQI